MPKYSLGNGIQVNCRGHLSWLQNVVDRLGPENMRRIRCSCFGHLFDIPKLENQGQLFNVMLRKLDASSHRRLSLSFGIGGSILEFGPEQFCAVTGLKFNGSPILPNSSTFHKTVFQNKEKIYFKDVDAIFEAACKRDAGESEICFKLALVYVVYCVFFIKERTSKCIDLQYMHLVDDLEKFVSYPWGAAAFEFLVKETHNAKHKLVMKAADGARLSVDAHGFITALQCWAYEVVPNLGTNVAIKVCEVRIPRILRWSASSKKIDFDTVNAFFVPSAVNLVPFEISDNEKVKLNILGVAEYIETLVPCPSSVRPHNRKRKLSFNKNSNDSHVVPVALRRSSRLAGEASPATSDVGSTPCRQGDCSIDVAAALGDLTKKFAAFEAANINKDLVAIMSRIEGHIARMASMQTNSQVVLHSATPTSPTVELFNEDHTPTGKPLPVPIPCPSEPVPTPVASASVNGVFQQKSGPAIALARRVTWSSSSGLIVPTPRRYDPFEADYDTKAFVSNFQAWLVEAKNTKSESTVRLPSRLMRHARYNWFESIWCPEKWLCSDHLDALINLLIFKQRRFPDMFLSWWTCLEQHGWITMTQPNFEAGARFMKPYIAGVYPHQGGVPWHEANAIYAIANVNKNHWVALQILLEEQKLVVYNSMSSSINWKKVPKDFVTAAKFMPWLCERMGIWEKRNTSRPLRSVWEVVEYPSPPQQVNGYDCGIMAMKVIECLVSGHAVDDLDAERCSIYRRSYCGQLYDYGQKIYTTTS